MFKMLVVFGFLSLLNNCAIMNRADLVSYDFETKDGVVSYLNDGIGWAVDDRRQRAEAIMRERCGGDFKITKQMTQSQYAGTYATATPNSFGGVTAVGTAAYQKYIYLMFKCQ